MEGFRFTMPCEVRSSDINSASHVGNARILEYFQDARAAYLKHVADCREQDVGGGLGLIIPEAHVRYLAQIFLGESLVVGARVEELRRSSFVMGYRIEREGQPVAEGTTPLVVFDYGARAARPLPEAFRGSVAQFEELPVVA